MGSGSLISGRCAGCNSGYTAKGGACLKNLGSAVTPSPSLNAPAAPAPVPTTTPSQPSTTMAPSPSSSSSSTTIPVAWSSVDTSTLTATSTTTSSAPTASANPYLVDVDLSDISAFNANTLGWNTNSLISWYHTDSSADSTNGHSWW